MNERYLIVDGVIAAQTPKVEYNFLKILPKFNQIIEIGFHRGGFSLWLHKNKPKECKLFCYDITFSFKEVNNDNITFLEGDCFNETIVEEIKNIIMESGKTLVLCDGGHKNDEFNLYSKFLKKDDVIMCHDYAESIDDFNHIKKYLNWPHEFESNYENIKDSISNLELEPFYYDDFKKVLWGSFIKK